MTAAALLALLLTSAPEAIDDGRGSSGVMPDEAPPSRERARVHGAATATFFAGFAFAEFNPAVLLGGEIGAVINDSFSLFAVARGGTVGASVVGNAGAMALLHFSDTLSAGAGVGFTLSQSFFTYTSLMGLTFPVRFSWAPWAQRPSHNRARNGVVFSLEAAPGFDVRPTGRSPQGKVVPPAGFFSALLSAAWAVW